MTEEVAYGQYAKAYEAIHSALRDLMAPPPAGGVLAQVM